MIGQIRGILVAKIPPDIHLEVGGITYEIQVPLSTLYQLPEIGQKLVLHTHFVVREDAQLLYGFYDAKDKAMFRALIRVNGVGPKLGLAILSGMEVDEFVRTVRNNDAATLVNMPGIGKKKAARIAGSWNEYEEAREALIFLQGHGLGADGTPNGQANGSGNGNARTSALESSIDPAVRPRRTVLVLGGGGYALYRGVPRSWTHLMAVALDRDLDPDTSIPADWTALAATRTRSPLPVSMRRFRFVSPPGMGLSVNGPQLGNSAPSSSLACSVEIMLDDFRLAKRVVVAGIAKLEQIPADERLDPAKLIEDIRSTGAEAEYIPTADEIVEHVVGQAKEGDILCVLSNGGFGNIHQKLLDALAK